MMNPKVLLILIMCLLTSCSEHANQEVSTNKSEQDVDEFKVVFFQMCLTKSLGREKVAYLLEEDNSTSSEFILGLKNYKRISELADSISMQIRKDSLDWQNKICKNCNEKTLKVLKEDGKIGKRALDYCLDYFVSTELDSIARARLTGTIMSYEL